MEVTEYQDLDEHLKARFTLWLDRLMYRARINYLEKYYSAPDSIGLTEIPEELLANEDVYDLAVETEDGFVFEEERLAQAYRRLPLMKKRILSMSFVDQLSPTEIAECLHCSIRTVYNQKYRAIKALKEWLGEE